MDLNDVDVSGIDTRFATGPLSHGGYGEMMVERRRLEEEEKGRRRGKKVGGVLLYVHIPGDFLKWTTLQRTFFHSPMSHVIFPICILFLSFYFFFFLPLLLLFLLLFFILVPQGILSTLQDDQQEDLSSP